MEEEVTLGERAQNLFWSGLHNPSLVTNPEA